MAPPAAPQPTFQPPIRLEDDPAVLRVAIARPFTSSLPHDPALVAVGPIASSTTAPPLSPTRHETLSAGGATLHTSRIGTTMTQQQLPPSPTPFSPATAAAITHAATTGRMPPPQPPQPQAHSKPVDTTWQPVMPDDTTWQPDYAHSSSFNKKGPTPITVPWSLASTMQLLLRSLHLHLKHLHRRNRPTLRCWR